MIKPANGLMVLGNSDGKSDVLSLDLLEEDLSFAIAENRYTNQELIDSVIELGEVIASGQPCRVSEQQITVADLTGIAPQDIAIGQAVCDKVES